MPNSPSRLQTEFEVILRERDAVAKLAKLDKLEEEANNGALDLR
jgi:hypothetical protein